MASTTNEITERFCWRWPPLLGRKFLLLDVPLLLALWDVNDDGRRPEVPAADVAGNRHGVL
jgi:hypothetical protein